MKFCYATYARLLDMVIKHDSIIMYKVGVRHTMLINKTLASIADDLIIMAYQYNPVGTKSQVPEPNSLVDQAIQLAIQAGVPKSKLLLGISLSSETPSSVDDKLGLAKRYDLKGVAFWRLGLFRSYNTKMEDAVNASVIKE